MALETFVKNNTHGSITLEDGTPSTPVTLVVPFDNGAFSLGPLQKVLREIVDYECRGMYTSSAYAARIYPEGSFTAKIAEFSNSTAGVLSDFIMQSGGYSANLSVLGDNATDPGIPVAVHLEFTLSRADFGANADQVVRCEKCIVQLSAEEGEPSTFTVNFKVLGAIKIDGVVVASE